MEREILGQRLYDRFSDLRIELYQAIANHELSYHWLHVLSGDMHQVLESVDSEMARAEQEEKGGP